MKSTIVIGIIIATVVLIEYIKQKTKNEKTKEKIEELQAIIGIVAFIIIATAYILYVFT